LASDDTIRMDRGQLTLGGLAPRMMATGVALALLGFGVAYVLGWRHADEAGRGYFYHAYLTSYVYFLSITLGALFFVLLHHLARAGWSVVIRRIAEGLTGNFLLMALLFLPLVGHLEALYQWARPEFTTGGTPWFDKVLFGKSGYLNSQMFLLRMGLYFVVWIGTAAYFRVQSGRQDESGDVRLSRRMGAASPVAMILLGVTLTLAAVDLLMSLNPHWYSTIFGVYFFAGCTLSFLITTTILALWLRTHGRASNEITPEHYHDLGKLTFAFTFFWGYIAFSQYMLIWYANMPDETQFFAPRQLGLWAVVGLVLVFCHILLPFGGLLSRHSKRLPSLYVFWGAWLLLAHFVDMFWIVMPSWFATRIPDQVQAVEGGARLALPEALAHMVQSNTNIYALRPEYARFADDAIGYAFKAGPMVVTLAIFVGMGGLYLASTAWMLSRRSLVPLKDPRLAESLAFENT